MKAEMLDTKIQPLNFDSLIDLNFDGDAELFRDVISSFLEEQHQLFVEIEKQFQLRDYKKVHALAHKLKGLFASFNSPDCVIMAARIEILSNAEDQECLALISSFKSMGKSMKSQLENYLNENKNSSHGTELE